MLTEVQVTYRARHVVALIDLQRPLFKLLEIRRRGIFRIDMNVVYIAAVLHYNDWKCLAYRDCCALCWIRLDPFFEII